MLKESWLRTYLRYTEKHEAPELFHFWIGVSVLSAALGRKVFFRKGYYKLYPNFFTVLVAGSARCRKTTAIEIGARFLKGIPSVSILSGRTSTEKFIDDLRWMGPADSMPPAVFVKADELSVFLTRDPQGEKLIDTLTKLFDCPDDFTYKVISRPPVELRDVYVSVLAGTQPSMLEKVLPDTAFGGGFASRIIFVYQSDTPRRNALPKLSPEELQLETELKASIDGIAGLAGEFHLEREAESFYEDWYNHMAPPEDDKMDGFFGRKGDHVLRLAMILRVAQGPGFNIQQKHVDIAIKSIDHVESLMPQAFSQVGHKSDMAGSAELVLQTIHRVGGVVGIQHSTLLKRIHPRVMAPELHIVITTLMQAQMVNRRDGMNVYICMCEGCAKERP